MKSPALTECLIMHPSRAATIRRIIGWSLVGLVAAFVLFVGLFVPVDEGAGHFSVRCTLSDELARNVDTVSFAVSRSERVAMKWRERAQKLDGWPPGHVAIDENKQFVIEGIKSFFVTIFGRRIEGSYWGFAMILLQKKDGTKQAVVVKIVDDHGQPLHEVTITGE